MNKTVLLLLLALYSASAFTQWGGSGGWGNYGGYGGYSRGRWSGGFTGGWGNSADFTGDLNDAGADYTGGQDDYTGDYDVTGANGGAFSCPDAIDNVNSAFDQLVEDVRAQVNEWIVYSDLDAVDEVSYYLISRCDVQKLDVVTQGSKSCKGLGELLKTVVQQAETGAFRAGYQQGAQLSEQALSLGEGVEKGCQVRVVKKQQQRQPSEQEEAINQEEEIEQPQQQHRHQAGQKHEALTNVLYKKVAKKDEKSTSSYGNDFADQYTSKYAGKYSSQYTDKYAGKYTKQYGKDYVDQGKSMTRLGQDGQGKKYGDDQAALSHKINQEYTDKYNKGKNNQNDQWKKYQEKYQHNNEEENTIKNEEESAFTVDAIFFGLTWM